jgi:hypothetical protein
MVRRSSYHPASGRSVASSILTAPHRDGHTVLPCYGFLANIHFYRIETPLRAFIGRHPGLGRYCEAMHAAVTDASPPATGRG